MQGNKMNPALLLSIAVFAVFIINVALGKAAGAAFLSDIGEAIVLFIASTLFVVATLISESRNKTE